MAHRGILDWTLEDIEKFLHQNEQENLSLEYKASPAIGEWTDAKRNELAKDICAFANSAGGIIIIGITEIEHKPAALDHGVDTRKVSKEAIESALRARIAPRIDGLLIKEIPNPRRVYHAYFVIRIPRSMRAPHMCVPFHRYYKRYNFECVPMEHYEVEDVRRRQSEPDLTVQLTLTPTSESFTHGRQPYRLEAGVLNLGSVSARDVLVRLYIPRDLVGHVTWSPNDSHQTTTYNGQEVYRFDAYIRDGAGPIPIYPKDDQPYMITRGQGHRITLHLPEPSDPDLAEATIIAHLFADGMRHRSEEYAVSALLGGTELP
jgi:hypothetical protein